MLLPFTCFKVTWRPLMLRPSVSVVGWPLLSRAFHTTLLLVDTVKLYFTFLLVSLWVSSMGEALSLAASVVSMPLRRGYRPLV